METTGLRVQQAPTIKNTCHYCTSAHTVLHESCRTLRCTDYHCVSNTSLKQKSITSPTGFLLTFPKSLEMTANQKSLSKQLIIYQCRSVWKPYYHSVTLISSFHLPFASPVDRDSMATPKSIWQTAFITAEGNSSPDKCALEIFCKILDLLRARVFGWDLLIDTTCLTRRRVGKGRRWGEKKI